MGDAISGAGPACRHIARLLTRYMAHAGYEGSKASAYEGRPYEMGGQQSFQFR